MFLIPKRYRDEKALEDTARSFADDLAAAQKLTDPADRIQAMLSLKSSTQWYRNNMYHECQSRISGFEFGIMMPAIIGCVVGGVALASVAPVVGLTVLLGGIFGGGYTLVTDKLGDKLGEFVFDELNYHRKTVYDLEDKAAKDIKELLATKTNEIAASAKFDSIFDTYPEVRNSFIKSFNKAVARKELPAPQVPQPQSDPGQPKFAL
jgi:hypothetical protein